MLRFSLKQSDQALLGSYNITILIRFKISVNEYIHTLSGFSKLKRESSLGSLLIYKINYLSSIMTASYE